MLYAFFLFTNIHIFQHLRAKPFYRYLCLIVTVLLGPARSSPLQEWQGWGSGPSDSGTEPFPPHSAAFLGWSSASRRLFETALNCLKPEGT